MPDGRAPQRRRRTRTPTPRAAPPAPAWQCAPDCTHLASRRRDAVRQRSASAGSTCRRVATDDADAFARFDREIDNRAAAGRRQNSRDWTRLTRGMRRVLARNRLFCRAERRHDTAERRASPARCRARPARAGSIAGVRRSPSLPRSPSIAAVTGGAPGRTAPPRAESLRRADQREQQGQKPPAALTSTIHASAPT